MRTRIVLSLAAVSALTISAAAQTEIWQLDPPHCAAQFAVRHMGISTVRGTFTKLSGTLQYDPTAPAKSPLDVTIDAASVDSRVEMRDNDVRGPKVLASRSILRSLSNPSASNQPDQAS